MDLPLTAADRVFRDEVRAFLAEAMPPDIRAKGEILAECTREEVVRWFKILAAKGWLAAAWPKEAGGPGWSLTQRLIFDIEANDAGAPRYTYFGTAMCGPVLLRFGTPEQKARFIPPILAGDAMWCQGYSEPGAGSDLASLKTRAVREGDEYVVTGSKIWTTQAHWADWIFALVRTSDTGKKQEGISFLLIDMKSPGITVRPILRISGVHEFNQVFFDGVRVPVANRIGNEGQGWTIAKYLLGHERFTVGAGFGSLARFTKQLRLVAQREQSDGRPLAENPAFRRRMVELEAEVEKVIAEGMRILSNTTAASELGFEASRIKLTSTRVQYELAELMMDAAGYYGQPHLIEALLHGWGNQEPVGPVYAVGLAPNFFDWRKMRIGGGGSDEISHEIIAKNVLRL